MPQVTTALISLPEKSHIKGTGDTEHTGRHKPNTQLSCATWIILILVWEKVKCGFAVPL